MSRHPAPGDGGQAPAGADAAGLPDASPARPLRLMLVGSVGCGKTTLVQRLNHQGLAYAKTQTTQRSARYIDTPGEYLTYGYMRRALQQACVEADVVGLLQSASETRETIPPGFRSYFTRPVIGIVTKADLADAGGRAAARRRLERAGARVIVEVSAVTGEGIEALARLLEGGPHP